MDEIWKKRKKGRKKEMINGARVPRKVSSGGKVPLLGGCKTWEIDSDVDGGPSAERTRPEVETFVRGRP